MHVVNEHLLNGEESTAYKSVVDVNILEAKLPKIFWSPQTFFVMSRDSTRGLVKKREEDESADESAE